MISPVSIGKLWSNGWPMLAWLALVGAMVRMLSVLSPRVYPRDVVAPLGAKFWKGLKLFFGITAGGWKEPEAKNPPKINWQHGSRTLFDLFGRSRGESDGLFELLKLEYERSAERYENIYKAIWQNFSYMGVLAAGILTFGIKVFVFPFLYFAAASPIVFWYLTTFLPLDHYGDQARSRLSQLEKTLASRYSHIEGVRLAGHYGIFKDARYRWRVREALGAFAGVIIFFWLGSIAYSAKALFNGGITHRDAQRLVVQPDTLRLKVDIGAQGKLTIQNSLTGLVTDSLRSPSHADSLKSGVRPLAERTAESPAPIAASSTNPKK